jgi:hypothetical protein
LTLCAIALDRMVSVFERRLLRWRPRSAGQDH